jgi:RHS repeat-associated protein
LNQTRQFNMVNEITSINGPVGVVTPLYDPVGNMTTMPAVGNWTVAQTLKWDAWNRLVRISEGSSTIAEYSYDALFRRVTKTVSGTTRRFYYSDQWQVLEEYLGSAADPHMRYWYGLRDMNDIARRQRYSSGTTLQDDLYALRETMNVVALVDSTGSVQHRMAYDAFGNTRFLTSAFAAGSNAAGWNLLFHGHYRDADTGLYQMRFRYYHTKLGVWLSRDPIGERGGGNLYSMTLNAPLNNADLYGLCRSSTVCDRDHIGDWELLKPTTWAIYPMGANSEAYIASQDALDALGTFDDVVTAVNAAQSISTAAHRAATALQELLTNIDKIAEKLKLAPDGKDTVISHAKAFIERGGYRLLQGGLGSKIALNLTYRLCECPDEKTARWSEPRKFEREYLVEEGTGALYDVGDGPAWPGGFEDFTARVIGSAIRRHGQEFNQEVCGS